MTHADRWARARPAVAAMEPFLAVAVSALGQLAVAQAATPLDAWGWGALTVAITVAARAAWGGVDLARLETAVLPLLAAHALIFPAVHALLGYSRLPLGEADVRRALLAHLALMGGAWGALAVADLAWGRPRPMATLRDGLARWAARRPLDGSAAVTVVALAAAVAAVLYGVSTGFFFAFGGADRRLVYLATGEERLWLVRYAIQGLLLWSLAAAFGRPGAAWRRAGALGAAALFIVAVLGVGGRRDIIGVLLPLAALGWMAARTPRARALVLGGVLAALLSLFAFAAIRTWSGDRSVTDLLTLYDLLGEFLFPWQVVAWLLANAPAPLLGASYLYPLVLWIPRSAWAGKPVILTEQFSVQAGVADQLGFGFSPVAEAVWNFGSVAGPWLGGVLVALALRALSARAGAWPLLYLAALGRLLSVPRSEFASVGGELLVLAATFLACDALAQAVSRVGAHQGRGRVQPGATTDAPHTMSRATGRP
ncbi:MAG: hypothetical protein KJT01_15380 [Gemmatimonadetes bacterium]|nr:hypothetical protein [Gemmatimonadota bacterium]